MLQVCVYGVGVRVGACVRVCVRACACLPTPPNCIDKRLVAQTGTRLSCPSLVSHSPDRERLQVILINQLASRIPFSTFNNRRPPACSAPGGGRDSLALSGTRAAAS